MDDDLAGLSLTELLDEIRFRHLTLQPPYNSALADEIQRRYDTRVNDFVVSHARVGELEEQALGWLRRIEELESALVEVEGALFDERAEMALVCEGLDVPVRNTQ